MLGRCHSGNGVYVNLISSSAGHYLSRWPHGINLIQEALTSIDLRGARAVIEYDTGRNIGNTDIVTTTDNDIIYYAQQSKTETFSRFAKNRFHQASNKFTIVVEQDAEGDYEVLDTWIGPYSPPFPGDKYETADSKAYWQTHALVHDAQVIQSKTITKTCPY